MWFQKKINKLVHQPTSMGCFLEGAALHLGWGMLLYFCNLLSNQKFINRINRTPVSVCLSYF